MISLAEIRADDMIDEGCIGRSRAMCDVFDQIRMVAPRCERSGGERRGGGL
jgi:hypothetical protein